MFERLISSAKLGIIFDTAKLLQKFLYFAFALGTSAFGSLLALAFLQGSLMAIDSK